MSLVLFFLFLGTLNFFTLSFNVSPHPNIILEDPSPYRQRSSYFGFSVNLRKNHILIGAPRANSTIFTQSHIEEPGLIYKCTFNGKCEIFIIDDRGNANGYYTNDLNNELKYFRLLGFSMDGHEDENDKFVACAPKQLTNVFYNDTNGRFVEDYYMFGACYYTENTKPNYPKNQKIAPLRNHHKLLFRGRNPNYMFGESGFSVHIPDTKDKIISGCPGVADGKGSINDFEFQKRNYDLNYQGTIFDGNYIIDTHDYFGYALTTGKLLAPYNQKLFYISSAPRSKYYGTVLIFSIAYQVGQMYLKIDKILNGEKYGAYFGYTLICDDFNNDGKLDIAISAPFYSEDDYHENGAVYIYLNQGLLNFQQIKIQPKFEARNTRFGMALGKIGDINGDGFNDLAISGNSKGKGVIYIYHGSKSGMSMSQKIEVSDENSMFGFSISRGVDIDQNGYNDFAVGAPNAESVFIFQSYPVVKVFASLKPSKIQLERNDRVSIKACIGFKSKFSINYKIRK